MTTTILFLKNTRITFLILALQVVLFACKKDINDRSNPSLKYTNSNLNYDFEDIGQIHNFGLEYIRQEGGLPNILGIDFATHANGLTFTFFKNNYMPDL